MGVNFCIIGVPESGERGGICQVWGLDKGFNSYSPCSITDHSPTYSAAHGSTHQSRHLDRPWGSRQFCHKGHRSLDPLQEEVLRAESRGKAGAQGLV